MKLLKIRKVNTFLVGLMMMTILLCCSSQVQAAQDDYTYTVTDGKATITRYTGTGGVVTIPSTLSGATVTSIAANAFGNSNSITTITVPDSVTDIGHRAFEGCENLISVMIGSGVSTVGEAPFMYCLKLQEIKVSSSNPYITSLDGVLFNKDKTKLLAFPNGKSGSYTIPDGVETLANRAFCWSKELTSLKIPDSITTLEYYSLAVCEKLSFVEFNGDCAGLTSIRDVFNQSNNLETLTICKNVGDIDAGQFAYNTKLYHIKIHTENQHFSVEDEILFNKEKSKLILSPKTISGEYRVPICVIEIQPAAFYNCTGLTDIYISRQTTKIGDPNAYHSVFGNRTDLTIHGDDGSAAQQYAKDNNLPFVIENGTGNVAVTGVKLNKSITTIDVGANETLSATITPTDATNKNATWSTSDPTIAMVDQNGIVKAIKAGTATITVTTQDGSMTASCTVTVKIASIVKVTKVSLNKSTTSIDVGGNETLIATITPTSATNQKVTWKSSKTAVATVDSNGKVTGASAGTAVITVTTVDGKKTATCKITVKNTREQAIIKWANNTKELWLNSVKTNKKTNDSVTSTINQIFTGEIALIGLGKALGSAPTAFKTLPLDLIDKDIALMFATLAMANNSAQISTKAAEEFILIANANPTVQDLATANKLFDLYKICESNRVVSWKLSKPTFDKYVSLKSKWGLSLYLTNTFLSSARDSMIDIFRKKFKVLTSFLTAYSFAKDEVTIINSILDLSGARLAQEKVITDWNNVYNRIK